ncbi:STAS domain-containing protein [Peribacillus frigoritolerans]|uniref:STAS domain-containing protein n=1 Tax=Peribacillus frigoritolerans TaxID=450367 RepID=UPI0007BF995E|nr:STAS domain-containing protein [Peribacillus frigoritolerans]MEB2492191.1 STAS domain-containing protein [Peribacillus frigoritolerans]WHY13318.1 STAS domain-containing protein [Peribacillus frigoritolerans]
MDLSLDIYKLMKFIEENNEDFEDSLLNEASNVKDKIKEILMVGNIDLINNARKLVRYIIEGEEQELQSFAKQEGIAWATHEIPLTFKLEWVQAIRRTLWKFLQGYNEVTNRVINEDFFSVEKQINNQVDRFLNVFFITYSQYKDSLIMAQKELVENLSVPIIPITPTICILPLIGAVDLYRTNILEEKVLIEIGKLRIQTLIMDLSGIMEMETEVIDHLMRIIDGTSLMGCTTVITGLRAEVASNMIRLGMRLNEKAQTLGTLQQALNKYLIC